MKVGVIAIIGRPNVGKSSLLNAILEQDIAIVTSKPQTTRDQIRGFYSNEKMQLILIDTPGIHKPKAKLGEILNSTSYKTLQGSDVILYLFDSSEAIGKGYQFIVEKTKNVSATKVALLTKIDLTTPNEIQDMVKILKDWGFEHVWGISIKSRASIDSFFKNIYELIPEGEMLYEEDEVTDRSMRFIAKEIIRESAINNLEEEVPYSIAIEINEFIEEQDDNGKDHFQIDATIFVERESQKGIVIGKEGQKIKKIGTESRLKINQLFNGRTTLSLKVKVKPNWTNNSKSLKNLGYGK